MNANEIRIGCNFQLENGVLGGGIATIRNKYDLDVAFDLLESNSIKPIPLTEEWLEKFGFEKQDYNMSGCDIYKLKNIIIMKSFVNPKRKYMGITLEGILPPTWSLKDLIHVHELQNLYFALMGEELTFKPE